MVTVDVVADELLPVGRPWVEVRQWYSYGPATAKLNDRELYGQSTDADWELWRRIMHTEALDADQRTHEGVPARVAFREAQNYGRAAYHYACGWYDALKRDRPDYWTDRVLTAAYYFGLECEVSDYAYRTGRTGVRYGFGTAWEIYRARHLFG